MVVAIASILVRGWMWRRARSKFFLKNGARSIASNAKPENAEKNSNYCKDKPATSAGKPAKPESNAHRCGAKKRDKHWLDYATFTAAVIAAMGAMSAAGIGVWQGRIAKDQERRSLRAYAFTTATPFQDFKDGVPRKVGVNIGMVGQSPAYNVKTTVLAGVLAYPALSEAALIYDKPDSGSVAIITAGSPVFFEANLQPFTDQDWSYAKSADVFRLYVWGRTDYTDIFGTAHYINFCVDYVSDSFDPAILKNPEICAIHNDVDQ